MHTHAMHILALTSSDWIVILLAVGVPVAAWFISQGQIIAVLKEQIESINTTLRDGFDDLRANHSHLESRTRQNERDIARIDATLGSGGGD